jgi:hypothetical protein
MGVPGPLVQDYTDALMGYGAAAAWIQEAAPQSGDDALFYDDPEPGMGAGKLWLKEVWRNCKVVALFDGALEQARFALQSPLQLGEGAVSTSRMLRTGQCQ